jgi:hypothetical protein
VKEDLGAHRQKGRNHRALHYRRIPVFLTGCGSADATLRPSWRSSGWC